MKRLAASIFLITLIIACSGMAFGQKSNFEGTWNIDRDNSKLPENLPTMSKITISFKGDSLLTERVYDGDGGQEMPFTENMSLDGKECKITIYEMPRTSKAIISEKGDSLNIESVTTVNGGQTDFISKETWKLDKATNTLAINFVNKLGDEEGNGVFIFKKAEAGK